VWREIRTVSGAWPTIVAQAVQPRVEDVRALPGAVERENVEPVFGALEVARSWWWPSAPRCRGVRTAPGSRWHRRGTTESRTTEMLLGTIAGAAIQVLRIGL
jgi:hypothetical protein